MTSEQLEFLITQADAGTLDVTQRAMLDRALLEISEADELMQQHASLTTLLRSTRIEPEFDPAAMLSAINAKIDASGAARARDSGREWRRFAPLIAAAAIVLGLGTWMLRPARLTPAGSEANVTVVANASPKGHLDISIGTPPPLGMDETILLFTPELRSGSGRVEIEGLGDRGF